VVLTFIILSDDEPAMPRKWLKKMIPDTTSITRTRSLGFLSRWIHDPNLWHLTRHSASMAFLVGIIAAFVPLPAQMFIAAAGAILVRANLPIAVALTFITNPLTTPPLIVVAVKVGAWVLDRPTVPANFEFTWEWLCSITWVELQTGFGTLLVGSFVCGFVLGIIGMVSIRLLWRWHVIQRWRNRKSLRTNRHQYPVTLKKKGD
jgi:uncharacterized protein